MVLYAKLLFKLAEREGRYIEDLTLFWFPAVYNSAQGPLRKALIQAAEELLNRPDTGANKRVLAIWKIEKKIMEKLCENGDSPGFQNGDSPGFLQSPRFAARFGDGEEILRLIRKKWGQSRGEGLSRTNIPRQTLGLPPLLEKGEFGDSPHFSQAEYYTLGAYYTQAGPILLEIEAENYARARELLLQHKETPPLSSDPRPGEFLRFGLALAKFRYGLYLLERGEKNLYKYFSEASFLFEIMPELEKKLCARVQDETDMEKLGRYEELFNGLVKTSPSRKIKETLAHLLVTLTVFLNNTMKAGTATSQSRLRRALLLNPDDEYAGSMLAEANLESEMNEMVEALNKAKFSKATDIALGAREERVREEYFRQIGYILASLEGNISGPTRRCMLQELLRRSSQVEAGHPVVTEIKMKLQNESF